MSAKESTESGEEEAVVDKPEIPSDSNSEESDSESESSKKEQTRKRNCTKVLDGAKASVRLICSRLLKKIQRRSGRSSG